jgi:hypothetical protein
MKAEYIFNAENKNQLSIIMKKKKKRINPKERKTARKHKKQLIMPFLGIDFQFYMWN